MVSSSLPSILYLVWLTSLFFFMYFARGTLKYQWISQYGRDISYLWLWVRVACTSAKHLCFKELIPRASLMQVEITQDRVINVIVQGHCCHGCSHTSHRPKDSFHLNLMIQRSNGSSGISIKMAKLRCLLITINFIYPVSIREDPKQIDHRRRAKVLVVSSSNFSHVYCGL